MIIKREVYSIRGQFVSQHVALFEAKGTWQRRVPISPHHQRMAARHTWCQIDRVLFVLLFAFPEMWDRWNFISAPSEANLWSAPTSRSS